MSLEADIAAIMADARAFLAGTSGLVKVLWLDGVGQPHSVAGIRTEPQTKDPQGSLYGEASGLRGGVRITLSDCAPWTPPQAGDLITLTDSNDVDIGIYTVLTQRDDQAGITRLIQYGEASA